MAEKVRLVLPFRHPTAAATSIRIFLHHPIHMPHPVEPLGEDTLDPVFECAARQRATPTRPGEHHLYNPCHHINLTQTHPATIFSNLGGDQRHHLIQIATAGGLVLRIKYIHILYGRAKSGGGNRDYCHVPHRVGRYHVHEVQRGAGRGV